MERRKSEQTLTDASARRDFLRDNSLHHTPLRRLARAIEVVHDFHVPVDALESAAQRRSVNPEGIVSSNPGLPRPRGYPGSAA